MPKNSVVTNVDKCKRKRRKVYMKRNAQLSNTFFKKHIKPFPSIGNPFSLFLYYQFRHIFYPE